MSIQFKSNFFEGPEWLEAGPLAHSLYVLACDYADRKDTDGIVPRSMLPRLALSTPESVVESTETLLRLGMFKSAHRGNSVEIAGYLEDGIGFSSENKEEIRAKWKADKKRRRDHSNGIHTDCNPRYCPAAKQMSTGGTNGGSVGGSTGASSPSSTDTTTHPTRPDPTRSVGEGESRGKRAGKAKGVEGADGSRSPASAGAPAGSGGVGAADGDGGADGDPNVYPGTHVQRADLAAEQVDPDQPQLRIEPDGDADRIYVAAPLDPMEGPAPHMAAEFIRGENRAAAAGMTSWGRYGEEGSGSADPAWILAPADRDVVEAYARAYTAAAGRR